METFFDSAGNEVQALKAEEAQKIQEERDALVKEKEELIAEKARLEDGNKDKDENFKSFRTKLEGTEKQLEEVNKRLTEKEAYERTSTKNTLLDHFAGTDEESRKKLEAEYALINIDESTPENIASRMEKAARMSGLYKETTPENVVFAPFSGGAPLIKPTKVAGDGENIVNTEKGKSILGAMGIPTE